MNVRGIRGAIDVPEDQPEAVLSQTRRLLQKILESNPGLQVEDIGSIIFTSTQDLTSAYPAQAARELGWDAVPMVCCQELPVPHGLPRCVRVLLHWNTNLSQQSVHHVYLGAAVSLRPDLAVPD